MVFMCEAQGLDPKNGLCTADLASGSPKGSRMQIRKPDAKGEPEEKKGKPPKKVAASKESSKVKEPRAKRSEK